MPTFDYDVVIIGSGFGGSVAALRAVEKGYRVAVMEAGRRKVSTLELREFSRLYHRPYEWLVGEARDGEEDDALTQALYRTSRELSERDREQLLCFAQFLRGAGGPPQAPGDDT